MRSSDEGALLQELTDACKRLAEVVELPARIHSDRTPAPWTYFDEPPDEALLARLLTALGAWDPDDPQQPSAEAELNLVEFAAHARNLIEGSSLGELGPRLLQQRVPQERIDKIRRTLEKLRPRADAATKFREEQ